MNLRPKLTITRKDYPLYCETYKEFPEVEDVYLNIRHRSPLKDQIVSTYSPTSLDILIMEVFVPRMLKEGLVRQNGEGNFYGNFDELHFDVKAFSPREWAEIYVKKARILAQNIGTDDSPNNLILGDMTLRLPLTEAQAVLKCYKELLQKHIAIPFSEGKDVCALNLTIMGRINQ